MTLVFALVVALAAVVGGTWLLLRHVTLKLLSQQALIFKQSLSEVGALQAEVAKTTSDAVSMAIVAVLQALPQFAPTIQQASFPNEAEDLMMTPWHQVPEHDAYGEAIDPTDALMPDPLDIRDFGAMINPDDPNATGIQGFTFEE